MMNNILIVGLGNICRSPLAERLLAAELQGKHTIWSAGLDAAIGARADPMAQEVAAVNGLDLLPHVSKQLTAEMCNLAQLILVMDQSIAVNLGRQFPDMQTKVFRLGEIGNFDVVDPYCQKHAMFQRAFEQIQRGVRNWVLRIGQLTAETFAHE